MYVNIISRDYSSISIDYNYGYDHVWDASDSSVICQTFMLPDGYARGSNPAEQRIPDISGFQILTHITDTTTAAFNWTIGYVTQPVFGVGNVTSQITEVGSGTTQGASKSGMVWFDIIFDQAIPVTTDTINNIWIIQLECTDIDYIPFFHLGTGGYDNRIQGFIVTNLEASPYSQNMITSLSSDNEPVSCNFRVLSLAGDSGTDFLNNPYRSVVLTTPVSNINASQVNIGGIGNYWMSPALPASDAVASLYFDMRRSQNGSQNGQTNIVPDPSFEYDVLGTPSTWDYNLASGSIVNFSVINATTTIPASTGVQLLELSANTVAAHSYIQAYTNELLPVTGGLYYSGFANISWGASPPNAYGVLQYDWYSGTVDSPVYLSSSIGTIQAIPGGNQLASLIAPAPVGATLVRVTVTGYSASSSTQNITMYIDGICVIQDTVLPTAYFDGDSADCEWAGQPGDSSSVQIITNPISDDPIVVDALVLNPIFPNQHYNIYYSNDNNGNDATPVTSDDWENKLWTRAASLTSNFGNETQVLPQPIGAAYIKIELTNPQMQPYDPGTFQLPINYKTFPSWVQNYFFSQVDYPTWDTDQVVVQSDSLTTLYTPDLSDLQQSPVIPSVPSPTIYSTSSSSNLDNTTLGQIDLTVSPYQDALGVQADTTTIIGAISANQINNVIDGAQQVTEAAPPTYPAITTVSSLQRDSILGELLSPDMYFFYTCRHGYMEKQATIADNKAYFFGMNNIVFLRSQGEVVGDSTVYTETGIDMINASVNDFTLTNQGWWDTYASS
jgi:hypothetical protein